MKLLSILQQTISPHISSYSTIKIKESATPAVVYRLVLDYGGLKTGPSTVILKRIQSVWPDDQGFPNREIYFYACVLPSLDIPHGLVFHSGIDPETQDRLIIMEDLVNYHLPPPIRPWRQAEGECIARAYARLHTMGQLGEQDQLDWLFPRHETRLEPEKIKRMACELVEKKVWEPIPGIDTLTTQIVDLAQSMTSLPNTLLHNDVYPPNVALPPHLEDDAILIDWEMASYGIPEMDLGFMFLQPFRAHRLLDKTRVLAAYWEARNAHEGHLPPTDEREMRQFYADAVWGLWLIPVAHRMAAHPYPSGSAVAAYWDSMTGVLNEHLINLSGNILL